MLIHPFTCALLWSLKRKQWVGSKIPSASNILNLFESRAFKESCGHGSVSKLSTWCAISSQQKLKASSVPLVLWGCSWLTSVGRTSLLMPPLCVYFLIVWYLGKSGSLILKKQVEVWYRCLVELWFTGIWAPLFTASLRKALEGHYPFCLDYCYLIDSTNRNFPPPQPSVATHLSK